MNNEDIFEEILDEEFDWDSEINSEDSFTLLPEGDYNFTVTKFERARHNGSEKVKPCPKAVLTLTVTDGKNSTSIIENLLLTRSLEWKLSQFFISIGQKKHGEPLKMNWTEVQGATGRCHVIVNKWKNKNGEDRENNRVDKFLDPENKAETAPVAGGWKAGSF